VVFGVRGCLLWFMAAGGVLTEADAVARLEGALARALEANERLAALVERQREENARLREELAVRDGELGRVNAELAVLKRMLFGRSSERARPGTVTGDDGGDGGGQARPAGSGMSGKRGPGARAGRRDYSRLPRVEVVWDFPGGGYRCPECGTAFGRLGDHVTEVLDWLVIVRVSAHCRRRYRRACGCAVPVTVTAPGPSKAIGKGLVANAFIARWLTERYVAGRSQNSLITSLARHGAGISPATLTGTCAAAGGAAGPAARCDHRAVAGLVAPTCRRDQLAGVRPARGGRPGEVVAVGLPRPRYRLLRHGPHPLGRGAGPACRDRPDHRPTH